MEGLAIQAVVVGKNGSGKLTLIDNKAPDGRISITFSLRRKTDFIKGRNDRSQGMLDGRMNVTG